MRAALERDLHHTPIVREQRFVAITKVETPYLDVLVRGAGDEELRVIGDVHGEDGKLKDKMNFVKAVTMSGGLTLCPYSERKNLRVSW